MASQLQRIMRCWQLFEPRVKDLIEQAAGQEMASGALEPERFDDLLNALAQGELMQDLAECGSTESELWPTLELLRHQLLCVRKRRGSYSELNLAWQLRPKPMEDIMARLGVTLQKPVGLQSFLEGPKELVTIMAAECTRPLTIWEYEY